MSAPKTEPALEAHGITKTFGDFHALSGLDLSVGRGEIIGFIGPNGAGKSTFLRIAIGLVPATAGTMSILGMEPGRSALEIRRRTSYLPGETNVYPTMTGRQFLDFNHRFYGTPKPMPKHLAEHFDLPLKRSVRSYSAGMKQKLALRATLEADVDLYLLDEPDRALDADARHALREWIQLLRNDGRSVLLSSHHLAEVEALADRSVFLLGGRNVDDSRIAEARATLRHRVRLRTLGPIDIPDGCRREPDLPDGTIEVFVDGDPNAWLAKIPGDQIETAELGAVRLDDIYHVLTKDQEVAR